MYIGVDLGGTKIAAGLVDDNLKIIKKASCPTNVGRPYSEIIKDIACLIEDILAQTGYSKSDIKSIGLGSPGVPDIKNGVLVFSNNMQWDFVPVRAELQKYFNTPVYLDNDANCAAIGEYAAGAAKQYKTTVLVTLGTGIGGGIVLNDKIHNGFNYAGGEIGHMVIKAGGIPCSCGRDGCWERYASVTGLIYMANNAAKDHPESMLAQILNNGEKLNGRNIFDCAKNGDKTALKVVEDFRYYIAVGITNIINILQPEAVVVGGGISNEGEYLLAPVREQVAKEVYTDKVPLPHIIKASLGNDAGIIGAAIVGQYQ